MILRWLVSLLLLVGVAALSRLPYGPPNPGGVLRLSWKTLGEKIRVELKADDGDAPDFMRPKQGFEEHMRDYRLHAEVDGRVWLDRLVRPPGLHHDRPISVFEELPVAAGEHDVSVTFTPEPADGATWKPSLRQRVRVAAGQIFTVDLVRRLQPVN